jgi:hypothetical protein
MIADCGKGGQKINRKAPQFDSSSKYNAMVNDILHNINQIAISACSLPLLAIIALLACSHFSPACTSLLANPQQFTKETEPAHHL